MSYLPSPASFAAAAPAPAPLLPPRPGDWLRQPLWANRGLFIQVALAAALVNLFALATTVFSMTVYNKIVPANATASMTALLIGIAIVLAFDFALRTLRGYFTDVAGKNIDRAIGEQVFGALTGMKLADRRGSHGAFAGLLREFETLREFFASATVTTLVDVPFVLLFLAVIMAIAPVLAIVPLVMILIVIGVAWASQAALDRYAAAGLVQGMNKQGIMFETIACLEMVKTSRAGPLLARRWRSAVADHATLSLRQRLLSGLAVNAAATGQSIVYVATVGIGVGLMAVQELSMGALIAASMLGGRCVAPLGQIAGLMTRISHTRAAYQALDRVLSAPSEARPEAMMRRTRLDGRISFQNVVFRYPGSDVRAIDDLSFEIAPGERVAIIGRVGSGKSTIARLVMGLYEPQQGSIRIDDSDIRQLHPDDLRANIGAVLQDVTLLSGTLRDNIALGDPAVSDAAVLAASRLAGAHDFIGQFAEGYDRLVSDRGEGLSGGQRQAIAVARALTLPRPILLFDEPTSAMDIASETALIDRLATSLDGQTMLIVTHRQSMLRLATRIIAIEAGRIIADGPRDEMLKSLTRQG